MPEVTKAIETQAKQNKYVIIKDRSIPEYVFLLIAIAIIIACVISGNAYIDGITKITSSGSDLQTLAIFSSIFVPLTFLVFFDVTRQDSWKAFKHSKQALIFLGIFLMFGLYLTFAGASLSIVNAQQSVLMIYLALTISTLILFTLLAIYIFTA
ncbi:MAG: hypothetical protein M1538_03215 [Candidatus Marsarchaeota archaeon]|jgi:hypothetical protein|nr:hypothetical protein [Candidatus Marsarchaeota archaeon]